MGVPIIEPDGSVVFLYLGEGDEQSVRLVGDFRTRSFFDVYWDESGEEMTRVSPSGALFFTRRQFEKDARLDYKFVVDGRPVNDPFNPRTIVSGTAPAERGSEAPTVSVLRMPEYRSPLDAMSDEAPRGELRAVDEEWARPKVTVYLPPDYDDDDATVTYPVVYTTDGEAWLKVIDLPATLDFLIANRAIQPVIAVMIDAPVNRSAWYLLDPNYLTYLETVLQHVDSHFSTRARPEERLHVGTSAGGRATLYAGFERPHWFRNLGMLSPSLAAPPHYFEPYFTGRKRPHSGLKVWLSAGTYEGYIYEDTRAMERYFDSLGLESRATYTHEGHSLGAWRNAVPAMLEFLRPERVIPSTRTSRGGDARSRRGEASNTRLSDGRHDGPLTQRRIPSPLTAELHATMKL